MTCGTQASSTQQLHSPFVRSICICKKYKEQVLEVLKLPENLNQKGVKKSIAGIKQQVANQQNYINTYRNLCDPCVLRASHRAHDHHHQLPKVEACCKIKKISCKSTSILQRISIIKTIDLLLLDIWRRPGCDHLHHSSFSVTIMNKIRLILNLG